MRIHLYSPRSPWDSDDATEWKHVFGTRSFLTRVDSDIIVKFCLPVSITQKPYIIRRGHLLSPVYFSICISNIPLQTKDQSFISTFVGGVSVRIRWDTGGIKCHNTNHRRHHIIILACQANLWEVIDADRALTSKGRHELT